VITRRGQIDDGLNRAVDGFERQHDHDAADDRDPLKPIDPKHESQPHRQDGADELNPCIPLAQKIPCSAARGVDEGSQKA
jgi:hypothetical protein